MNKGWNQVSDIPSKMGDFAKRECIEVGLETKLLILESQAKGYVESCFVGEQKYNFDENSFDGKMYIASVILAAHAKIKSKGVLKLYLVDWRAKAEISGKINLVN